MKILFVCKGNVGRSQFAEGLFKKYIFGDYYVASAGTTLSGPEQMISEIPGAINVIETMKEEEIDVSRSYRNQLSEKMINDFDKVIMILDDNDPLPEYISNNPNIIYWKVDNPKGMDLDGHKKVKDQIKNLILKEFTP